MAIAAVGNVLKIFGESSPSEEKQKELYREVLLKTLARASRSDANIHPVETGGGGCFGFAWWQNDSKYEATVWDLTALESAGTVSADVSGTSFLPAVVIPIPLLAGTRSKACKGLADQLKSFIVTDESA